MMEARFTTSVMCPVLIGRGHDLTTLRLLVDRAKSGQGQVALVSGDAGGSPPSTLTPLDPEQEKRRRFEILAHFLTSQTSAHPVLLVVEDLHWSDDTSLEFLHYLARRCSAHRLLILLTYRSDEVRSGLRHFLAQLNRERLTQEILLARLTRDEVEAMLRSLFALPR